MTPFPSDRRGTAIGEGNLSAYGQAPLGLEGSGAFRRPGSIVRVLRTERWVRPTERAGSEGSFICRCLGQRKPSNRASLRGPPIGGQDRDGASYRCSAPYTLLPLRGISPQGETRDMRVKTGASYASCTTPHFPLWWLAPPPFPRKRGQYKAPLCCELLMKGLLFRTLFCPLHRGKSGAAG